MTDPIARPDRDGVEEHALRVPETPLALIQRGQLAVDGRIERVQLASRLELLFGLPQLPALGEDSSQGGMRAGQPLVELHGLKAGCAGRRQLRRVAAIPVQTPQGFRQPHVSRREIRILTGRFLEGVAGFLQIARHVVTVQKSASAQVGIVRARDRRCGTGQQRALLLRDHHAEQVRHFGEHAILQLGDVGDRPIDGLAVDFPLGLGVDHLDHQAQFIPAPLRAAGHHQIDAELAAGLRGRRELAGVHGGDDGKFRLARQRRGERLCQPIGERLLRGIPSDVAEGKHGHQLPDRLRSPRPARAEHAQSYGGESGRHTGGQHPAPPQFGRQVSRERLRGYKGIRSRNAAPQALQAPRHFLRTSETVLRLFGQKPPHDLVELRGEVFPQRTRRSR